MLFEVLLEEFLGENAVLNERCLVDFNLNDVLMQKEFTQKSYGFNQE
jgi:hypothetical protein